MKRPLPLWIAAAVPATLAGHGLAYALAGRSAADGHHAWLAPAFECSLAILLAASLLMIGGTLLKAGILMHTAAERSCMELWPRLACMQLSLFFIMEHAEGAHVSLLGAVVQIALAAAVAYVLSLFARLLVRCMQGTQAASRYLERLLSGAAPFVGRRPQPALARALAVRAGTSRFQRPPPGL